MSAPATPAIWAGLNKSLSCIILIALKDQSMTCFISVLHHSGHFSMNAYYMSGIPIGIEETIKGTWPLQGSGFMKTYTNNYNTMEYMLENGVVQYMTDSFTLPSILYSVIVEHEKWHKQFNWEFFTTTYGHLLLISSINKN